MSLLKKLMSVNLIAVAIVLIVVYVAIEYFAASYFMTLIDMYEISPTDAHRLFLEAVYRALGGAAVVSLAVAFTIGLWLSNRILRPLTQMTEKTRRISDGDYGGEVEVSTKDEVGQLALAFNRMTQELERSDQMRRQLVVDVAHELRTPLTNLRGYSEALRDGVIAPTGEALESLHDETLRIGALVEDMLFFARADSLSTKLEPETLDIVAFVSRVQTLYQPRLDQKQLSVSTGRETSEPEPILVHADPTRLAQVVHNLFENVCRYTPDGGSLEISMRSEGAEMVLEVINQPVDVPAEAVPRLFDRFFRPESSRSRDDGGAGVGLAIVKEIVTAHRGQVGANLRADALEIWCRLPLAENLVS